MSPGGSVRTAAAVCVSAIDGIAQSQAGGGPQGRVASVLSCTGPWHLRPSGRSPEPNKPPGSEKGLFA